MNCRRFRELAHEYVLEQGLPQIAGDGPAAQVDASVELERCGAAPTQHAGECEHCARYWRGLLMHAPLLSRLERLSAPGDLAGRVVAAMHAGYRESRAAAGISRLARLEAPPVLARRIEEDFRVKAPAALDRLVERRVDGEGVFAGARADRQRRALVGRTFAAALLLGAFLWLFAPERLTVSAETRPRALAGAHQYGFEIVRVGSIDDADIDEGARAWIDAVTGGVRGSK